MVSEKNTPMAAAEYERVICQVKGVLSARLVTGADGSIEEIHVLAAPDRNPKQVVRDIETAVLVQLGEAVDRKKISIAQLDEGAMAERISEAGMPYGKAQRSRLRLVSLGFFPRGSSLEARVTLELGSEGRLVEGRSVGPGAPGRTYHLVAQATLEAARQGLGEGYILALEDLLKLDAAGTQAVLVVISLLGSLGRERLAGIAFLDENPDELQATAQAVLRALACRLCLSLPFAD